MPRVKPPNAGKGRPKGSKNKRTVRKEMEEAELRSLIRQDLETMLGSQIANAKGIKYLVVRDRKGGKFLRVTESMAKVKLGSNEEEIEVWEKDPNVNSFKELLDRAYGKPKESLDVNLHVTDQVLANLVEGRKRVAAARKKSGNGSRKR